MQNTGFNLDALIDAVAERVVAKVRAEFAGGADTRSDGAGVRPRLLSID